nr:hypothetical protein [uncultured bacterium]
MKNSTQVWRRAIAVVTLLVMASTGVIAGQPKKDKKSIDEIVADVLRAPRSSNEINSPADSPVTILDSNSTEISRSTLRKLTGTETAAAKAVSYPQVTLLNNSNRAVKEVLLLLTNKATGTRTRLKVGGINIAPHETYVVEREKWTVPALIGIKSPKAGDQPRTLSMKDVLRYDSNRAWMLGGAADLSVMVALVEQDNGNRWDILRGAKISDRQPPKTKTLQAEKTDDVTKPADDELPVPVEGCWCQGTVICFDDGSWICWGTCYNCTLEDCAICAIIGCTVTCWIIMD